MAGLTRKQVELYFKSQGHPDADESWYNEFMNAGHKQHIYDEIVLKNHELCDVARWFHLMKVMGVEMRWETFLVINNALWEENIETLDLSLPEVKTLDEKTEFVSEKKFIFDDELIFNDDNESLCGYLWSVDILVDKLDSLEIAENINFYTHYNVRTGEIKLFSTYDTPIEDGELNKVVDIVMTDVEKEELVVALEAYCKRTYSKSCLEFVNEIRTMEGMTVIEVGSSLRSLDEQIDSANTSKSEKSVEKSRTEELSF